MNHDRPSADFATHEYIRPNVAWECGHACEGCPCRIGPSPKGECRATYECSPRMVVKAGETKGQWVCTRPKSGGGKCEHGPGPDGTCCKKIPKCQPRRTLRSMRKRTTWFVSIATILLLCVGLSRSWRDDFINPGPVSNIHASEHFSRIHHSKSGDVSTCAACHDGAAREGDSWHMQAWHAAHQGLAPAAILKRGPITAAAMDRKCLSCHEGKDFHQPNMPTHFACHECHKEHGGTMPPVSQAYCIACHGSAEWMHQARVLGDKAEATSEKISPVPSRPRPAGGYTDVITAFSVDHPEFRQIRDAAKDPNTLKFNHAAHLGQGSMPRDLKCTDCHQVDSRGEYQRPITYADHCQECHTLQFDEKTPGLTLPHGDPYYVRAFLRSLNIQYEEFGRDVEKITRRDDLVRYIQDKRKHIEGQYQTGENLEHMVFFSDRGKQFANGQRAAFTGCAVCHEVSPAGAENATPLIGKVAVPTRWMTMGRFDHAVHQKGLTCVDCHQVEKSTKTSDLHLPSIKSCIDCHSPRGGIRHDCMTCHSYHHAASFAPRENQVIPQK